MLIKKPLLGRVFPQREKMPIHNRQHIVRPFIYPLYLFNGLLVCDSKDFFTKEMIVCKGGKKTPTVEFVRLFFFIVIPNRVLGVNRRVIVGVFVLLLFPAGVFLLIVLLSPHANIYNDFPELYDNNEMPHSWFEHQLRVTNDVSNNSRCVRFFMSSFNSHITYYLFPKIHHVYYPEVTKVVFNGPVKII